MAFPVALQVYSVRDDAAADFHGTLKKIKDMGYDGIEFAGLYGVDPELIKSWLDELGLKAISAHVSIDELSGNPEAVCETYAKLGCEYVAVPYLPEHMRPNSGNWEATVALIEKIGKVFKAHGIQLLYHNHDFEFEVIDGKYALDILYDTISSEWLQTELDLCWVNVGGVNPIAYINKYSGKTPVLHFKDFVGGKTDNMYGLIGTDKEAVKTTAFELRPNGYGKQDFYGIINEAKTAGTKWIVIEQDSPSMNRSPLECAKLSIDYIKTINK